MLTPEGQPADKTDKIMLLAMWTQALSEESDEVFISAGMGKPTFPINMHTIQSYLDYWAEVEVRTNEAMLSQEKSKAQAAIGYGDPRGDEYPRQVMATAMSSWYETDIAPRNILFTVGGAGALRVIFETYNLLCKDMPKYRVITPFPHYTLYADNRHLLHPIDVMKEPGYRLTAHSIASSIELAYSLAANDLAYPKVMLLCNPSNPLGTVIDEVELRQIADVLRRYPELDIVLDEAYAEMCFNGQKVPSLLKIAPDLKSRVIIIRSATKALSAAGERMAVLMAFDEGLMGKLLDKNISTIGHAPRAAQIAYAETMLQFSDLEHKQLIDYYGPKITYVAKRLQDMGAAMPDPDYQVEGTFYILADFSDLFGLELPAEAALALEKMGPVTTNEELAYYLLFNDAVMLAPSSYFGLSKENGFMRITCSGSENELYDLMNRLENRLFEARYNKKILLINDIAHQLVTLKNINWVRYEDTLRKISGLFQMEETCFHLKEHNSMLKELKASINVLIARASAKGQERSAITLQSFFRGSLARRETCRMSAELDKEWQLFVDKMISDSSRMKAIFLNLSIAERLTITPWKEYLKNKYATLEYEKIHAVK